MDLDTFMIAIFWWIDEALPAVIPEQGLRQRGPTAVLHDSEVLTMAVVGEYLGLAQDTALFAYFQRHWTHFFPGLRHVHRTTFVRVTAGIWSIACCAKS